MYIHLCYLKEILLKLNDNLLNTTVSYLANIPELLKTNLQPCTF